MTEPTPVCLYCGVTSTEVPLVSLTFRDEDLWICPQHLPLLIHDPAKLIGKLPGADKLKPYES